MPQPPTGADAGKFAAARRAVDLIEDGMRVGLGTGSTAAWMVRALAARAAAEGLTLTCVPTSRRTGALASRLGLRVVGLDDVPGLDLTIDGADEFDGDFRLIKGGGAAHLLEKIVAAASDRLVVITDPTKSVDELGAFPLPVEVTPFGHGATGRRIADVLAGADVAGRDIVLRERDGAPVVTDEGNLIYDLHLKRIGDPERLMCALTCEPGVVETGLFLGMCDTVVIGHPDGRAETRVRGGGVDWADVDMGGAVGLPE
jgi:ribose 5-phosphate isomerase A